VNLLLRGCSDSVLMAVKSVMTLNDRIALRGKCEVECCGVDFKQAGIRRHVDHTGAASSRKRGSGTRRIESVFYGVDGSFDQAKWFRRFRRRPAPSGRPAFTYQVKLLVSSFRPNPDETLTIRAPASKRVTRLNLIAPNARRWRARLSWLPGHMPECDRGQSA